MAMSMERMHEIMTEVSNYTITLANDPTVLGAKYLQDLIATCRNYTNHVARLMNEVHREKMAIDFELRRRQTAFEIAADELLATNPLVRSLPNITDRQAQIKIILKEERRQISSLENDLKDIDHVEKLVRRVHTELKDAMGEIKLQRSLIRDEIDTGRMYGDERNSHEHAFSENGHSKPDGIDEADIERMLRGEIPQEDAAVEISTLSHPQPKLCSICQEPQFNTSSGDTCKNGHGGAEPYAPSVETKVSIEVATPVTTEEAEVMAFLERSEPSVAKSPGLSDEFSSMFDNL